MPATAARSKASVVTLSASVALPLTAAFVGPSGVGSWPQMPGVSYGESTVTAAVRPFGTP